MYDVSQLGTRRLRPRRDIKRNSLEFPLFLPHFLSPFVTLVILSIFALSTSFTRICIRGVVENARDNTIQSHVTHGVRFAPIVHVHFSISIYFLARTHLYTHTLYLAQSKVKNSFLEVGRVARVFEIRKMRT